MAKTVQNSVFILIVLQTLHSQTIIRSIEIERHNIFDPQSEIFFERSANALHTLTKESVIKDELLFKINDTLNNGVIYETERNLRKLGFIGDIKIQTNITNDTSAHLKVITYDRWTLNFGSSFKYEGGITNFNISASEDNFMGYGKSMSFGYNYVSDRKNPNGINAFYRAYRLFGFNLSTVIQYKNSEDLYIQTFLLEKPFYAESVPLSYGVYLEKGTERKRLFENGTMLKEDFLKFSASKFWFIYSFNEDIKYRIGTAYIAQVNPNNENFKVAIPRNSQFNISLGVLQRDFSPTQYVDNLGIVEDIPFGYSISLVTGKVLNRSNSYYFNQSNQISIYNKNFFYHTGLTFQGYIIDDKMKDASWAFQKLTFVRTSQHNIVVSRLNSIIATNWGLGRQIFLDSKNGLRGIPAYTLSGRNSLLLNIENRLSTNWNWWIFKLGVVFFSDIGTISNDTENLLHNIVYKSFGLGLRIFNAKQQGNGLTRIDFAYNFNSKGFEIILSSSQLFGAIPGLETTSPIVTQ